jgi:hypothetical protein
MPPRLGAADYLKLLIALVNELSRWRNLYSSCINALNFSSEFPGMSRSSLAVIH